MTSDTDPIVVHNYLYIGDTPQVVRILVVVDQDTHLTKVVETVEKYLLSLPAPDYITGMHESSPKRPGSWGTPIQDGWSVRVGPNKLRFQFTSIAYEATF